MQKKKWKITPILMEQTWSLSKTNLRSGMLQGMDMDNLDEILAPMFKQWWSPRTRSILEMIIASLNSK